MFRQIVNRRSASFLRQSDHVCSWRRQSLHRQSFYSLDALSRRNAELSRPQVPVSKMCPLISFTRAMSSSGPESPEQKTGVVKRFKQMFKEDLLEYRERIKKEFSQSNANLSNTPNS